MGRRGNRGKRLAALREVSEQCHYVVRLYGWMALALVTTALAASLTAECDDLVAVVQDNRYAAAGVIVGYFGIVGVIDHFVPRWSSMVTAMAFFVYAALTGAAAGLLYQVISAGSLSPTFLLVAGVFGLMSAYGYVTKQDLTTLRNLGLMALVGLMSASLLNLFRHNGAFDWVVSYIGVLAFVGLTGYGAWKLRKLNVVGNEGTEEDTKEAIVGAMALFLHLSTSWMRLARRRR